MTLAAFELMGFMLLVLPFLVQNQNCLQQGHAYEFGEEEVAFCHVLIAVSALLLQVAVFFFHVFNSCMFSVL